MTPHASYTDLINNLMCVSCHEPLSVAQSSQAISERNFVHLLVDRGLSSAQIMHEMVANYGTAVLGKPPASGFDLLIYVLPPALLALGIILLMVTLPRWRARARAASAAPIAAGAAALSPDDAERLDRDLASFS